MQSFRLNFLAVAMTLTLSTQAQVTLFEQEVSGLAATVGATYNPAIAQLTGDFEYTVEGRTTIGLRIAKPLNDTLFSEEDPKTINTELKQWEIGAYLILEFIEPSTLNPFSFSIKGGMDYEFATKEESNHNKFTRLVLGGGPIFSLRFYLNDFVAFLPMAGYEFKYVSYSRNIIYNTYKDETNADVFYEQNRFVDENLIWHDVFASTAWHFMLDELNGIVFEPRFTVKIGEFREAEDLINASARVGYVRKF